MTQKFPLTHSVLLTALALSLCAGVAVAQTNRAGLKAPNGIALSEFDGYENWRTVAPSQVPDGIKTINANDVMIAAYRAGAPGNGHAFPDGSKIVKIEWAMKKNAQSPYAVNVPDHLMSVSFIEKDAKRFPDTNGWGYAQFLYDPATDKLTAFGKDANFGKDVCHACHIRVKANDYIFTGYPKR